MRRRPPNPDVLHPPVHLPRRRQQPQEVQLVIRVKSTADADELFLYTVKNAEWRFMPKKKIDTLAVLPKK